MKLKLTSLFILLISCSSLLFSQNFIKELEEEIWIVVEKRNSTWKDADFEGHTEICHPNFKRWISDSDEFLTTNNLREFWDSSKEDIKILKLDVKRKTIQFFNQEKLAVAHYEIYEEIEYIGEDYIEENYEIKKGEIFKEVWRFSDYYVKEGLEWLYIGGNKIEVLNNN